MLYLHVSKGKLLKMSDQHLQSFFGQNTGLILNSTSKSNPYLFIRCIKRKNDGIWEKPSKGEGKVIKCSLEEIIMILNVLNRNSINWQSYHTYKDKKTAISFGWEDENTKTLWINIGKYSKMLTFAQAEIFRLLLTHILDEKITFATVSQSDNLNFTSEKPLEEISNPIPIQNDSFISESTSNNKLYNDMSNVDGIISGESEKALLINFNSGKEIWIPKSTIHCQYVPKKALTQKFLIDNWVLKRNKILT